MLIDNLLACGQRAPRTTTDFCVLVVFRGGIGCALLQHHPFNRGQMSTIIFPPISFYIFSVILVLPEFQHLLFSCWKSGEELL